ncbi:MAG TPA: R3H domain-containing nucleic acid-binding protein [Chloroflexia bacterium]|nr:R3H domain-containing nucleic acid-binding protein [Chloroflexia bacterium]
MRQVDIQARSVDEAVRLALEQLGRTRDQVKVEVLATDPGGDEVLVRVTAPDLPGASSQEEVSPRGRRGFEDRGGARPAERPERPTDDIEPGNRDDRGVRPDRDRGPRPDRPPGGGYAGRERLTGSRSGGGGSGGGVDRGGRQDRGGMGMGGGMGRTYGRPEGGRYRTEPQYDPDVPGEIEIDSSLQMEAAPEGEEGAAKTNVAPLAAEVLQTILLGMKIRGRIVRRMPAEEGDAAFEEDQDSLVLNVVDLNERDQNTLVGRRGETLDAIQFLVNLVLSKQTDHWARVTVDVEGYRLRRKHSLINLARRTADQVETRGQAVPLEAMPPHERRIIHMTLADHPSVTTESSGAEPERRVVVLPK